MLRPERDDKKPTVSAYNKFARIFGLVMTLVYVALGLFIMFAGDNLNLSVGVEVRYFLGGVLILYGIVRFIRVYQTSKRNRNNRDED
ncbi:hypothetical protein DXT99_16240 [Pontibacter diazotrophicus]|uniref:Uncharacterized protein n=1 Tax=Pontibacter diazotrophicus TaxID=1400979 RepID=A0A3D8L9X4_9BACT|nr:hypothetical protein [Pontibacter diazotrophicus]RDV14116.1 hypothetical protein DXT99_16240 [Pontibacter diazotrophicus]